MDCVFCLIEPAQVVAANQHCVAVRDRHPVSPGHSLVISRRHVGSFFQLSHDEQNGALALIETLKASLDATFTPDGYNIGLNDGPAAGQTVPHLHIHVIPRYRDDCPDPRGGVRWIFPDRARYWKA